MSKVDKCICCKKKIGVTQAELETGELLCITENTILIAMFCIFQCVIICSMFDPLMITNLLMIWSLLTINTKHYGIKISKFCIIIFLSTTNEIFWQRYSFGYLQKKDGYGISLWKETESFASMCGKKKIEKFFPQNSIADWKSMKSSINMKYVINIMKIHLQFIYFFNISITYYDLFAPTIQHTCIPYGPEHSVI